MKKFYSIAILCLIFFLTQTSCRKQGCTDLLSDNYNGNAKKDDGRCTYSATAFYGNYHVEDMVIDTFFNDTVNLSYDINLIESGGNQISIFNLYESSNSIPATIYKGNLSFYFNDVFKQISYNGTGTCIGDTIKWNYNINNGDRLVSGICVRQ